MTTRFRAALSIAMLLGFYGLAFGVIAALSAVAIWAWSTHPGSFAAKVTVALGVVVAAVGHAVFVVNRRSGDEETGLLVSEHQAPELWAMVRALAHEADTREPDEIRLIPEVNAAVSEDAGLLGLRGGTRTLYIGVPLLLGLNVSQLVSVLGHEMGHYSHSHTRLGEITYRGRATVLRTVDNLAGRSVVGWLFRGYAYLYLLVSQAVSRQQEYEADAVSVRVAGRATAAAALREVHVVAAAWGFFGDRYVGWALESGYAPADLFGGFGELLARRRDELARLRDQAPPQERSRWDSHPSLGERLAAIGKLPDTPVRQDVRPAVMVLGAVDFWLERAQRELLDLSGRQVVTWEQLTHVAALQTARREAAVLYRAASRVTGGPPALSTTLDALADGRAWDLIHELLRLRGQSMEKGASGDETAAEIAREIVDRLAMGLRAAAAEAGLAYWRHSWTAPAEFVPTRASLFDLSRVEEYAYQAYTEGAYIPELRKLFADEGMSEWPSEIAETAPTAQGAELVAAVSDFKVDADLCDVLILDTGLVLVPHPGRFRGGDQKTRLVRLAQSGAPSALAAAEGNRFLPFEQIASAVIRRRMPFTFELTLRDGHTVTLRQTMKSEELGEGFRALGKSLGPMIRD